MAVLGSESHRCRNNCKELKSTTEYSEGFTIAFNILFLAQLRYSCGGIFFAAKAQRRKELLRISMRNIIPVFFLLIFIICSCSDRDSVRVGIQPIGKFQSSLVDTISNTLQRTYGVKIVIMPEIKMPKEAFVNIKTPRYRADKIIKIAKQTKPDSLDYILCLTAQDISTSKTDSMGRIKEPKSKYEDWGIFGLGYRPGPTCVVSSFRLMKTTHVNFVERLKKVSVHELGHNLGLPHCESKYCVMTDAAEKISTIDNEQLKLCDACKKKL